MSIVILFSALSYTDVVCIPMGTNCAPLVADFLSTGATSLSHCYQVDIIVECNSISRYVDELLSFDILILRAYKKLFILVGWDRIFLSVAWPTGVQLFLLLRS